MAIAEQSSALGSVTSGARTPKLGARLRFGDAVYNDVMDFLIQEALLLDENRFEEWLNCLSPDIFYSMPVRRTVSRRDGPGFDSQLGSFLWDNLDTLKLRVRRITKTDSAFSEDPPSRTRRHVTNLSLYATEVPGEFAAHSNLLLLRNRDEQAEYSLVSALRKDLIRHAPTACILSQRTILIDQASLGMHNIAIFL